MFVCNVHAIKWDNCLFQIHTKRVYVCMSACVCVWEIFSGMVFMEQRKRKVGFKIFLEKFSWKKRAVSFLALRRPKAHFSSRIYFILSRFVVGKLSSRRRYRLLYFSQTIIPLIFPLWFIFLYILRESLLTTWNFIKMTAFNLMYAIFENLTSGCPVNPISFLVCCMYYAMLYDTFFYWIF